jgi:hypothetical protein
MAELDALPLRDRTLRSARAKWRKLAAVIAALPQLERPCAQLQAWVRSGWKRSARLPVTPSQVGHYIDLVGDREHGRSLEPTVRHLRRLGVPLLDAERVTGDRMLIVLEPAFDKRFERVFGPPEGEEY